MNDKEGVYMDKKEIIKNIALRTGGDVYLGIVGAVRTGKSTFINHLLTSLNKKPTITTSSIPNTTASYITIKLNPKLTIVDTPGFIDNNAIYNFIDYKKNLKPLKKSLKPIKKRNIR